MSSETEICNHALAIMGQEPLITMDDTSKSGRACHAFYPVVRDELLRSHPWPFAIRRCNLAEASRVDEETKGPYEKAYAIPDNCLRFIDFESTDFSIEGRYVLSNTSPLKCRYIRNDLIPNEFDVMFRQLLATKLAYTLVPRLTGDNDLMKYLEQKVSKLLSETRFTSSAEQDETMEFNVASWDLVRY